ncbi:AraC family transcriptional regulator [Variovorax sp. J22R133]|uniref:AraC family transcriptional regulator n=1 Tax=Variovorax brevis TaxID=3053503 RepID=UPI002574AB6D|nr:AraC family transcriptional regulator [Variovorax sp. J22R133]MDM0114080.1 AraC family transcriptional regulator [Variovorax sp. J22R133]
MNRKNGPNPEADAVAQCRGHFMEAWFSSELQPICQAPLFVSSDPDVVKHETAGAFKEHELSWRRGKVDSALYGAHVGSLSFFVLQYGAAVHIDPGELQGFVLFQVPLRGSAEIRVDGQSVAASPSTGAVISPSLPLQLDWHEGCRQLLVKIPRERVERTCRHLIDDEVATPIEFDPEMHLDNDAGRSWQHQLASHFCNLRMPSPALAPQLLPAQEEALIHHLLLRQDSNYSGRLSQPQPAAAPRHVRAAQHFIEAHLYESLTLEMIARASGASVRSLCMGFQKHLQRSPMAHVRAARLERARLDLLQAPPGTQVTDIALRWGFNHVGRFSTAYRKRYGELPIQTLRGA